MNGITRYILRQMILIALFVTAALSIAVWLVQSLRLIDLIVNRGLSAVMFLHLAFLILPRFIEVVLPVAVFIAVLFVYNKLASESEIVVMRAAGVSQGGLARPAFLAGLLAMVVLYALSLAFVPAANRAFKDLQFKIRNRFATVLIQDGVFNAVSDRVMVYDMGRNADGDLLGLVIYDARDPMKPVTIFAARGAIVATPEGMRLFMVDGTRQERDQASGHLSVLSFARYTFDLGDLGGAAGARDREPDERYTWDLLFPSRRPSNPGAARALMVELNLRLAAPLAGLAMALVPVLCLLPGEFNRRGQARRVLTAVILAFALEFVDLGLRDLSGRTNAALPLLYLVPVLPVIAAGLLLWPDRRFGATARALPRLSS
jgi:lipopolysaccharide export system permease protein